MPSTLHSFLGRKANFYCTSSWCGPCRQLSPILEKFSTDASIKSGSGLPIDVVKIDTENEQVLSLAHHYKVCFLYHSLFFLLTGSLSQVRALPTVVAFRNGEAVDQFVGMLGEDGVKRFLQKL